MSVPGFLPEPGPTKKTMSVRHAFAVDESLYWEDMKKINIPKIFRNFEI
jgi:hypothetical protein